MNGLTTTENIIMTLNLLPAQKELIDSTNKVVLLVGGYASGKTEGLMQKILSNPDKSIAYISIDSCLSLNFRNRITDLNKIFPDNLTLYTYYDFIYNRAIYDIVVLDDFGMPPYDEVYSFYNQIAPVAAQQLIMSCSPLSNSKLDENFCYQLSQEKYCQTIRFILTDNIHLPPDYLERIKDVIEEPIYSHYIESIFTYREEE